SCARPLLAPHAPTRAPTAAWRRVRAWWGRGPGSLGGLPHQSADGRRAAREDHEQHARAHHRAQQLVRQAAELRQTEHAQRNQHHVGQRTHGHGEPEVLPLQILSF
ncbi:MAG: hypothetical protein ACK55I_05280, partial [bacterium]